MNGIKRELLVALQAVLERGVRGGPPHGVRELGVHLPVRVRNVHGLVGVRRHADLDDVIVIVLDVEINVREHVVPEFAERGRDRGRSTLQARYASVTNMQVLQSYLQPTCTATLTPRR